MTFNGQHSIKTGFELFSSQVKGTLNYSSIFIRRSDNTLAQRIDFQPGLPLGYSYQEIAGFVQDRWAINPKVTLDFGFRFDREGVTGHNNFSPRFSVLYSPAKNGRTVIRGGIGIFYDRSSGVSGATEQEITDEISNVSPNFMQIPIRVVTITRETEQRLLTVRGFLRRNSPNRFTRREAFAGASNSTRELPKN